ncbi:calvin cycle protein CP12-3, chloroplastic [Quillaja saponaria]|uniref:Calvin cycle protein CP12-3, chloroplastic n=1 Tax=Quillaja saponaria TaxID=32244 RepID=A0AAD7LNX8_QUISA|nr:calvin cycle protein CP12-3, chloroplastic [Quillaja saponaria]
MPMVFLEPTCSEKILELLYWYNGGSYQTVFLAYWALTVIAEKIIYQNSTNTERVLKMAATAKAAISASISFRSGSNLGSKNPTRVVVVQIIPTTTRRLCVKSMAVAKFKGTQMREKQLTEMIEKKVMEAKEICSENEISDGCKVAWDEVEEVSQAKADLRLKMEKQDPLESFCQENPETDECRIYED